MDEQGLRKIVQEVLDSALEPIKKDLSDIKDTVDSRLLPSVTTIEKEIKSYADSYQQNQRNIEKLDKRLNTVEDDLGIDPPEELIVEYSSSELIPPPVDKLI